MFIFKNYNNVLRNDNPDDLGGGGDPTPDDSNPAPDDSTPNPEPTVADKVAERKRRIREKEEAAAKARRERFSNKPQEDDPEPSDDNNDDPPADDPDKSIRKEGEKEDPEDPEPKEEESDNDDESVFDDFEDDDEPDEDTSDPDDSRDDEDADEDSIKDKATWRATLKKQGEERKKAEQRAIEAEAKLEEAEAKLEELQDTNKSLTASQVNWATHDKVVPLNNKIDSAIGRASLSLTDGEEAKELISSMQSLDLMIEYYKRTHKATTVMEKDEASRQFVTEVLAEKFPRSADANELNQLLPIIAEVTNLGVEREDLIEELKSNFDAKHNEEVSSSYQQSVDQYSDVFDALTEIDDEVLEEDPDSMAAVVVSRYKSDPEFRKSADKQRLRMKELIFGLTPLTQKQLEALTKKAETLGITKEEYLKRREQNFAKRRSEFIANAFYNMVGMDDYDEKTRIYNKYLAAEKKRKARKEAAKVKEDPKPDNNPKKEDKKKETLYPGHKDWVRPSQRNKK